MSQGSIYTTNTIISVIRGEPSQPAGFCASPLNCLFAAMLARLQVPLSLPVFIYHIASGRLLDAITFNVACKAGPPPPPVKQNDGPPVLSCPAD